MLGTRLFAGFVSLALAFGPALIDLNPNAAAPEAPAADSPVSLAEHFTPPFFPMAGASGTSWDHPLRRPVSGAPAPGVIAGKQSLRWPGETRARVRFLGRRHLAALLPTLNLPPPSP